MDLGSKLLSMYLHTTIYKKYINRHTAIIMDNNVEKIQININIELYIQVLYVKEYV